MAARHRRGRVVQRPGPRGYDRNRHAERLCPIPASHAHARRRGVCCCCECCSSGAEAYMVVPRASVLASCSREGRGVGGVLIMFLYNLTVRRPCVFNIHNTGKTDVQPHSSTPPTHRSCALSSPTVKCRAFPGILSPGRVWHAGITGKGASRLLATSR